MNDKYFKNRNLKKNYSLNDLIAGEPIFKNDLIWKDGFSDWKFATEIEELKQHVLERPPERKAIIILKTIWKSLLPSLIIYLIFSFVVGISAGLIEKHQYDQFIDKVQPNIDTYWKNKQQQIEQKNTRDIENRRKAEELEQRKISIQQNFNEKDQKLKLLQTEAYNHSLSSVDYYSKEHWLDLSNNYLKERERNFVDYKTKINFILLSQKQNASLINATEKVDFTYDIPKNTLFADDKNGNRYTRWKVYKGVGNHEQLSYDSTHKFLFRPYRAIFTVVNLSNSEVSKNSTLLWNFTLAALVTNLMFFPLIVFGVIKSKK